MKNEAGPASQSGAAKPAGKAPTDHIGQVLKKRRTGLRLSLTEVELATKIRGKFLIALENGDYASLSHDVYSKGFVQSYAEFLGLNGRAVAAQYLAERGELPNERPKSLQPRPRGFVMTPRLVMAALAAVVISAIALYLAWQVSTLAAAPRLSVTNPSSDQVITGSVADVSGHVTLGADIFINDSPILTDGSGNFSEKIALQDGTNTIQIVAKNKLGKTTKITRSILAKIPQPILGGTAAAATIQGVAVVVTAGKSAVAITASVDGKDVFSGTMLAGTTQTFSGNDQVIISTNNAGQTALEVTNTVVAGKKLDPLGKEGEVKRNLEFDATTVIP